MKKEGKIIEPRKVYRVPVGEYELKSLLNQLFREDGWLYEHIKQGRKKS